jgi:hypothetical protein
MQSYPRFCGVPESRARFNYLCFQQNLSIGLHYPKCTIQNINMVAVVLRLPSYRCGLQLLKSLKKVKRDLVKKLPLYLLAAL